MAVKAKKVKRGVDEMAKFEKGEIEFLFELIKEYGVSLVGLVALAYYVKTQNDWITNELQTELRESFTRLESIVIKLIDNSKKVEIKQTKET